MFTHEGSITELKGYLGWHCLWIMAGAVLLAVPLVFRRIRLGYAAGVCLALMVIVAAMWVIDWSGSDELTLRRIDWTPMHVRTWTVFSHSMRGGISFFYEASVLHQNLRGCESPWFEWLHISHQVPWACKYPELHGWPFGNPASADVDILGFKFMIAGESEGAHGPGGDDILHCYAMVVPDWFVLLVLSILPAFWLRRIRRRRRLARWAREGCCMNCGYSLHGLPVPARCPECGTLPQMFQ